MDGRDVTPSHLCRYSVTAVMFLPANMRINGSLHGELSSSAKWTCATSDRLLVAGMSAKRVC